MIEVGRVCMKIAGREAGKMCVVTKVIDKNFVEVTGPKKLTGIKRRKCNIDHLEPLPYKLDIKEGASDEEVLKALEKAGLIKKFGLKKPTTLKEKKVEKRKKKSARKKKVSKKK